MEFLVRVRRICSMTGSVVVAGAQGARLARDRRTNNATRAARPTTIADTTPANAKVTAVAANPATPRNPMTGAAQHRRRRRLRHRRSVALAARSPPRRQRTIGVDGDGFERNGAAGR